MTFFKTTALGLVLSLGTVLSYSAQEQDHHEQGQQLSLTQRRLAAQRKQIAASLPLPRQQQAAAQLSGESGFDTPRGTRFAEATPRTASFTGVPFAATPSSMVEPSSPNPSSRQRPAAAAAAGVSLVVGAGKFQHGAQYLQAVAGRTPTDPSWSASEQEAPFRGALYGNTTPAAAPPPFAAVPPRVSSLRTELPHVAPYSSETPPWNETAPQPTMGSTERAQSGRSDSWTRGDAQSAEDEEAGERAQTPQSARGGEHDDREEAPAALNDRAAQLLEDLRSLLMEKQVAMEDPQGAVAMQRAQRDAMDSAAECATLRERLATEQDEVTALRQRCAELERTAAESRQIVAGVQQEEIQLDRMEEVVRALMHEIGRRTGAVTLGLSSLKSAVTKKGGMVDLVGNVLQVLLDGLRREEATHAGGAEA